MGRPRKDDLDVNPLEEIKLTSRLKEIRQSKGLTQMDISVMSGMKQPMLQRIESGTSGLTVTNAYRLSILLGEPLENFYEETYHNSFNDKSFDFLGMMKDWQLQDLRVAIDKELEKRQKKEEEEL